MQDFSYRNSYYTKGSTNLFINKIRSEVAKRVFLLQVCNYFLFVVVVDMVLTNQDFYF